MRKSWRDMDETLAESKGLSGEEDFQGSREACSSMWEICWSRVETVDFQGTSQDLLVGIVSLRVSRVVH